jgi:hypothetical protein
LADEMDDAYRALDDDPSVAAFAAFDDATEAWRAAGCEE